MIVPYFLKAFSEIIVRSEFIPMNYFSDDLEDAILRETYYRGVLRVAIHSHYIA